jgi:hypothetical protein
MVVVPLIMVVVVVEVALETSSNGPVLLLSLSIEGAMVSPGISVLALAVGAAVKDDDDGSLLIVVSRLVVGTSVAKLGAGDNDDVLVAELLSVVVVGDGDGDDALAVVTLVLFVSSSSGATVVVLVALVSLVGTKVGGKVSKANSPPKMER